MYLKPKDEFLNLFDKISSHSKRGGRYQGCEVKMFSNARVNRKKYPWVVKIKYAITTI